MHTSFKNLWTRSILSRLFRRWYGVFDAPCFSVAAWTAPAWLCTWWRTSNGMSMPSVLHVRPLYVGHLMARAVCDLQTRPKVKPVGKITSQGHWGSRHLALKAVIPILKHIKRGRSFFHHRSGAQTMVPKFMVGLKNRSSEFKVCLMTVKKSLLRIFFTKFWIIHCSQKISYHFMLNL